MEQVKQLVPIDLDQLQFVGQALGLLRQEVGGRAAVLGFVGCPWTLSTYIIEGASSTAYKRIKGMMSTGAGVGHREADGCAAVCPLRSAGSMHHLPPVQPLYWRLYVWRACPASACSPPAVGCAADPCGQSDC
jgi:hypothetical protein